MPVDSADSDAGALHAGAMRKRIDLAQARGMLRSRGEFLDSGLAERQLRAAVADGRLIRPHWGSYVPVEHWDALWPEGQHLLKVLAVRAASPGGGPLFTHESAAVVWGLPLYGMGARAVQTRLDGARHSRRESGVIRRDMRIADSDIIEVGGLRVTSLARTVFDVARTASLETAVGCADAAMRSVSVAGHMLDVELAESWRSDALALASAGMRGVRQARQVLEFADGRAQLPGESVSRVHLHRLGFHRYDLQVRVVGAQGDEYWLDFAFSGARRFGEFDGEEKYTDAALRSAVSAEQAVLDEKRREDDVRGVTGWAFARWGHEHIRTAQLLGRRLAAFGVHPPG